VSLDHFELLLTRVSGGVGGVACVNIAGICRVLLMVLNCCVCSSDPIDVFLWCMQCIWLAQLFVVGSNLNCVEIVGSL
jgi:hypothetical protein